MVNICESIDVWIRTAHISIVCLFSAMEKALLFIDNRELPPTWKKEELLGSDDEDQDDDEEVILIVF